MFVWGFVQFMDNHFYYIGSMKKKMQQKYTTFFFLCKKKKEKSNKSGLVEKPQLWRTCINTQVVLKFSMTG